jgi:hypothetical protein
MKIIPHSRPQKIDTIDYIRYLVTAIALGLIVSILTLIAPILILIGLIYLIGGDENPEIITEVVESSLFEEMIYFFSKNDGHHFFLLMQLCVLTFILKYLFDLFKRKLIFQIILDENNIEIKFQTLFGKIETRTQNLDQLKYYSFKNSHSEFLGSKILISFQLDDQKFIINTNAAPWSMKDEKKLNGLNKKINEGQQSV